MGSRTATLKDVALAAGVSITTASVVLNGKQNGVRVGEQTRRRVRQTADELGYRPNQTARALRQQSSRTIGFLSDRVTTTPYAVAMIAAAQELAAEHGHLLFVVNIADKVQVADKDTTLRLDLALDQLVEHQVTRFVVAGMSHRAIEPVPGLPDSTVFVNAFATHGPFRSIVPDERGAARAAVTELLEHGHQRIAFLDDDTGTVASGLRHEGYRDALRAAGIEPDPRLHPMIPPIAPGASADGGLLDLPDRDRPTAVFCFNDRTAMCFYRAAGERGLRIPDDISVVGFDDQQFIATELQPALTTMRLPLEEMGRLAIAQLLGDEVAIDWEAHGEGAITRIACPLVRRDSVARPAPAAH
jgi:LacI family transcriptional regulator